MPVVVIRWITSFQAEHIRAPEDNVCEGARQSQVQYEKQSKAVKQEGTNSHEIMPLNNLSPLRTVRASTKRVGKHDAAQGVTTSISTMRIHLASIVASLNINLGLVDKAYDLDI